MIIVCECGVEFAPGYGSEGDECCQWCDPAMCRCGHTAGNHANGDNGPWGCGLCFECEMFVDAVPAHHHYSGASCAERGRTCTQERCRQMVEAGLLREHSTCESAPVQPLSDAEG